MSPAVGPGPGAVGLGAVGLGAVGLGGRLAGWGMPGRRILRKHGDGE